MSEFLMSGNPELLPKVDDELGIRYPQAEESMMAPPAVAAAWLEEFAANGILERRLVKKNAMCPHCNSPNTEKLVDPTPSYTCSRCGQPFREEDAVVRDLNAYGLSDYYKAQFNGDNSLLRSLREEFIKLSYDVSVGGVLRGASGTDHRFNLVCLRRIETGEETLVLDVVASEGFLDENPILVMFAKKCDTDADKCALIAIPGVDANGRKLANLYNITLIEANSATEVIDQLRSVLSR